MFGFVVLLLLGVWLVSLPLRVALADRLAKTRATRRAGRAWGLAPTSWRGRVGL